MKKLLIAVVAVSVILSACKKDKNSSIVNSSSIVGRWHATSGLFASANGESDTTWNLLPLNDTLTIDTGHYFSVTQVGYGFYDGYYAYADDTIMASQSGYYPFPIQVVSLSSTTMVLRYGIYNNPNGNNPQFDLGNITYVKL